MDVLFLDKYLSDEKCFNMWSRYNYHEEGVDKLKPSLLTKFYNFKRIRQNKVDNHLQNERFISNFLISI